MLLQCCTAAKCYWSLFFFELLPLIESTASGRAYPLWLKAIKSGRNMSISTPLQRQRPLPPTKASHKAYTGISACLAALAVVEGPTAAWQPRQLGAYAHAWLLTGNVTAERRCDACCTCIYRSTTIMSGGYQVPCECMTTGMVSQGQFTTENELTPGLQLRKWASDLLLSPGSLCHRPPDFIQPYKEQVCCMFCNSRNNAPVAHKQPYACSSDLSD